MFRDHFAFVDPSDITAEPIAATFGLIWPSCVGPLLAPKKKSFLARKAKIVKKRESTGDYCSKGTRLITINKIICR